MTPRPFQLMVDSGSREEPPTRYFGTLKTALAAADELGDKWRPYIWISEQRVGERPIVHVKDGKMSRCPRCGMYAHAPDAFCKVTA